MPNRAIKNRRKPGASVQRSEGTPRPGAPVTRRTGLERPDKATAHPAELADPQARVIKTRS